MGAEWMQRVHVPQGFPKASTDVAPTSVFLFLYFVGAVTHMTIFQRNRQRGYKFIFNVLCFGFCMARLLTTSLRLAWIYNIEKRSLGIAATIFVAAGVLILFIINLLFAQRILRGQHPHLGWTKSVSRAFLVLYLLVPVFLVMVITVVIQSWYTTSMNIRRIDLDIQRTAGVYLMVFSFLAIPISLFSLLWPKSAEPDRFGKGSFVSKAAVVITASALLTLGAAFRSATSFITIMPGEHAPWWNAKWCFYFFNFTMEIIVVYLYAIVRIDLMFYVPDGSKGPGDYSNPRDDSGEKPASTQVRPDDSRSSTASDAHLAVEPEVEKV